MAEATRKVSVRGAAGAFFLACAMAAGIALAGAGASAAYAADASLAAGELQSPAAAERVQAADYDTSWYDGKQSPYVLSGARQLKGLAYLVNSGRDSFEGKEVRLKESAPFFFVDTSIEPIGTPEHPFQGTFDGARGPEGTSLLARAGETSIGNLSLDLDGRLSYVGLFGYAGEKALIRNLTLAGGNAPISLANAVDGQVITHVGAIAGFCAGSIENCFSSVEIDIVNNGAVPTAKAASPEQLCSVRYIGGLAGYLGGDMENCTHAATLSIKSTSAVSDDVPYIAGFVGGIAGMQGFADKPAQVTKAVGCANQGDILFDIDGYANADRFGTLTYSKSSMVGGIAGYSMGNFSGCTNAALVDTGISGTEGPVAQHGAISVGGIVGALRGPELANPTSALVSVGGEASDPGYDVWQKGAAPPTLTVEKCENTGALIGLASVGGICGTTGAFTQVLGCANTAQIDGTRTNKPCPAGIVGIARGDIGYCSNTGRIATSTGTGYYAAGIAGLLITYNTSATELDKLLDPPELYGCYVAGAIVSVADGGYRSAVLAGENEGFVHDNCYLPNLTPDKAVPDGWAEALGYVDADGTIAAGHLAEVQELVERVNVLDGKSFAIVGGKVQDGKAPLERQCMRSQIVDADSNQGTLVRNWELSPAELRSSVGVAYLNRMNGAVGDWGPDSHYYKRNASADGYPLLSWQAGGIETGQVDLSQASGLVVNGVQNPAYSAAHTPVPTLEVTLGSTKLYQNADFIVVPQEGATSVGSGFTASICGMNGYTGERADVASYGIERCDVSSCVVVAAPTLFNWEKQAPKQVQILDDNGVALDVAYFADAPADAQFVWKFPEAASSDGTLEKVDASDTASHDGKYYDYANVHAPTYLYDITVEAAPGNPNYQGSTTQAAFQIGRPSLVYGPTDESAITRDATAVYDKVVYGSQQWDYLAAYKTPGLVKVKYTGQPIEPKVNKATYLGRDLRDGTDAQYWTAPLSYDFRYVYGNPNPEAGNDATTDCVNVTGSSTENLASMTVRFTQAGNFQNYSNIFFEITPASIADDVKVSGLARSYSFAGKAVKPAPTLTYNGMTLVEGSDYTVAYANNAKVGTASLTITGKGNYEGSKKVEFKVAKGAQPMKVKVSAKTVKASKLKKSAQKISPVKVTKAQGKVTFKLAKSKKYKGFKIDSKGKVTVPKGAAKKTYKLKITVKAKGNARYKAASKTVTVKIKVK